MKIKHIYYLTYVLQAVMALNCLVALWAINNAPHTWTVVLGLFAIGMSVWVIIRGFRQRESIRHDVVSFSAQGIDYWNT